MIKFTVHLSHQAEQDLRSIYEYLAFVKKEPQIAKTLYLRLLDDVQSLDTLPERTKRYSKEPWYRIGLQYKIAGNYLLFYLTDQKAKQVNVVRILYGGQDIEAQLQKLGLD